MCRLFRNSQLTTNEITSCFLLGVMREEKSMNDWQPKITAFLCNWCSYGAADLAGVSRFQYPPHFRVIRVPCSARVSPKFILAALPAWSGRGVGVGVTPWEIAITWRVITTREGNSLCFKGLLEHIGLEPGRLQFSWISSAEATKFVEVAQGVAKEVNALGPATQAGEEKG